MYFQRISLALFGLFFLLGPTNALAHNGQEKSSLRDYSFFELWNPLLFVGVIAVFLLYLFFINKNQRDNPEFISVSIIKKISFFTGLIVFYIALGTPLHVLGDDFLFSVHMLNQSLVYIVMPPLLLIGLEKWMVQSVIKIGNKYNILSILKVPLIPLILFNILFSFYHIPIIFDFLVSNTIFHNLTHIVLTISAFLMWIPVIPVAEELDKLSPLQKLGYIFAGGVLLTPACALIIFADEPMYAVYSSAPQLSAYLGPVDDQQTGGIIMKLVQELVYGVIIGYIFFKWVKQEQTIDENVSTINVE
ncbi:cytochrome c oxidase assembly protein [Cytobacillus sp. S13-E01]|uniref:cytochrome c oxidase assembly protein n=1 Tax=Cytobacillus sp. S13-E01 TaxID=3031326 RepID=UPI0023D7D581|nr:cytochrome c oxidase assembly protein [Cytobacillus sp. S13-E01]MDF0727697.1 cytochrome c oxidase assembly protein [Cytobacillus sp. S13-E01]